MVEISGGGSRIAVSSPRIGADDAGFTAILEFSKGHPGLIPLD